MSIVDPVKLQKLKDAEDKKKEKMTQTRFCFTTHNKYQLARCNANWDDWCEEFKEHLQYLQFQHEIGEESGKLHIQGYCELVKSRNLLWIKNLYGDNEMSVRKCAGSQASNVAYCSKEKTKVAGTEYVWGTLAESKQGERTDLIDLYELACNTKLTVRTCANTLPGTWMKFHQAFDKRRAMEIEFENEQLLKEEYKDTVLLEWQLEIAEELRQPVNRRIIRWIYDPKGNSGKSFFAEWAEINLDAHVTENGKTADMAHAFEIKPIIIIEIPRDTNPEDINYRVMEKMKDGRLFATKYQSRRIRFPKPHLLVLANMLPDITKQTADRWDISKMTDGKLTKIKLTNVMFNQTFEGQPDLPY